MKDFVAFRSRPAEGGFIPTRVRSKSLRRLVGVQERSPAKTLSEMRPLFAAVRSGDLAIVGAVAAPRRPGRHSCGAVAATSYLTVTLELPLPPPKASVAMIW